MKLRGGMACRYDNRKFGEPDLPLQRGTFLPAKGWIFFSQALERFLWQFCVRPRHKIG
jgi:hypothetical protein